MENFILYKINNKKVNNFYILYYNKKNLKSDFFLFKIQYLLIN